LKLLILYPLLRGEAFSLSSYITPKTFWELFLLIDGNPGSGAFLLEISPSVLLISVALKLLLAKEDLLAIWSIYLNYYSSSSLSVQSQKFSSLSLRYCSLVI